LQGLAVLNKEHLLKRICTLAAVVTAAAVAAGSAGAATPKLNGTVTDALKIFVTKGGKKVTTLKAGTYLLVVSDHTSGHNFHITGPGVNKSTSVSGKTTAKWTLTLKKGTYKYVCDPHKSFMKGSFTVK
jgi:plastocyanin